MLGLGITELIIIAGIALIVIGPEKFPEFAKIVTHTIRDVRGYVEEAQKDLSKELKPVQKEVNKLSRYSAEDYIDSLTGDEGSKGKHSKNKSARKDRGEDKEKKQTERKTGAEVDAGNKTGEETGPNQPAEGEQRQDSGDAPSEHKQAGEPIGEQEKRPDVKKAPYRSDIQEEDAPKFYHPPGEDQGQD
ncbi:MAG: twin-arginine translocase TatA/TatE family subunit [Candidatus Hydrogenedentota bacterium]